MTLAEYKDNPYAWPGGYQILAVTDDGAYLCHKCATTCEEVHEKGDADGWRIDAFDVYWEGPTVYCAHCNCELESEYGDPFTICEHCKHPQNKHWQTEDDEHCSGNSGTCKCREFVPDNNS